MSHKEKILQNVTCTWPNSLEICSRIIAILLYSYEIERDKMLRPFLYIFIKLLLDRLYILSTWDREGSIWIRDLGSNEWHESSKKWRNAPEMAILTKKSKIFIKAKLTVSKSYLLGLVYLMIFCILRGALI